MATTAGETPLLRAAGLDVGVRSRRGDEPIVRELDLEVRRGETLVILGESGSGKSMTALALMDLLPEGVHVTDGRIEVAGVDIRALAPRARRQHLGTRVAMVFQDSISALNPVMRVGDQIAEAVRQRDGVSRRQARSAAVELMHRVRIPSAERRYRDFPHQFSGGMRQRVVIAIALALRPALLIADEPTTALDVSVQAQILALLSELKKESSLGLVLITHDLGVAASVADRVAVMYAGRVVETSDVDEVFDRPAHPYTRGLLASVPQLDSGGGVLQPIPGSPPTVGAVPAGCAFHPRCPMAIDVCRQQRPELRELAPGHQVSCHRAEETAHEC